MEGVTRAWNGVDLQKTENRQREISQALYTACAGGRDRNLKDPGVQSEDISHG